MNIRPIKTVRFDSAHVERRNSLFDTSVVLRTVNGLLTAEAAI